MKTTLRTFKSFLKKNEGKLFIKLQSDFNGMVDCVESSKGEFSEANKTDNYNEHNLGVDERIWLVGGGRDYFEPFENEEFTGIKGFNSCGSWVVAIRKETTTDLTEEKVLELLEHFENYVTIYDDENELVLWRSNSWGIPEIFAVQFNGKFLKTAKTLKKALKFFNLMVEKYNLSTETILNEYELQK